MKFFKCLCVMMMALLIANVGLGQVPQTEFKIRATEPSRFIQTLGNRAIEILSFPNQSAQEREDSFRQILRESFAMDKIGRFVAGQYWRRMTAEQKNSYQLLFSEWVLKTYSIRLGAYSGEQFRVIRTAKVSKQDVIVHTVIKKATGGAYRTDWRVRRIGGRHMIIDVYIEGVSMAVTQRSEFDAVLRNRGVGGLIDLLRNRLSKLSAAS